MKELITDYVQETNTIFLGGKQPENFKTGYDFKMVLVGSLHELFTLLSFYQESWH